MSKEEHSSCEKPSQFDNFKSLAERILTAQKPSTKNSDPTPRRDKKAKK